MVSRGWRALLLLLAMPAAAAEWKTLPPLPDAEGFAGAWAGASHGALIVAGGANIPGDRWATPFVKKWYDSVFVLTDEQGPWRSAEPLSRPRAYGVALTWHDRVLCLGGQGEYGHHRECFALEWSEGAMKRTPLPPLPATCANACGAIVGNLACVAGGLEKPDGTTALHNFWTLDLEHGEQWEQRQPWPGPERMLAVAGSTGDTFFLFSGARLQAGAEGKPVREYLRDAWAWQAASGWRRLPDLPRPAVAAPSPAPFVEGQLFVISGDDGLNVDFQPLPQHPGFPHSVLAFDPAQNRWTVAGDAPFSRATAPCVGWQGRWIVPNGEVRPRVRTNEVWALETR